MDIGPGRSKSPSRSKEQTPSRSLEGIKPTHKRAPSHEVEAPQEPQVEAPTLAPAMPLEVTHQMLDGFLEHLKVTHSCPGMADLRDEDLETLRLYLTDRFLGPAWAASRDVEARGRANGTLAPGTRATYARMVANLKKQHRHGDAYAQLPMLTIDGREPSTSTKATAKTALNHAATRVIGETLPAFYGHLDGWLTAQKIGDPEARKASIREWRRAHYHDEFLENLRPIFDAQALLEMARAIRFLNENRPDPHAVRSRAKLKNAPKQGKKSKPPAPRMPSSAELEAAGASPMEASFAVEKALAEALKKEPNRTKKDVLNTINRWESRNKRRGLEHDFRSAFWKAVQAAPRMKDDRKAALAVMMTVSCRPAELAKGIHIHVLRASNTDDHYRIIARVPGTKLSHADILEDESLMFRRTAEDTAVLQALMGDPAVEGFHTKGQPWRLMEIECRSPEARWLAQYVRENASPEALDIGNMTVEEHDAFEEYLGDVTHHTLISIPHTPQDPIASSMSSESDRLKTIVTSFGESVNTIAQRALLPTQIEDRVTPYVFRHAYAGDLKAFHEDVDGRSAAMGHSSSRTISRYGSSQQAQHSAARNGTNRASQLVKVKSPNTVRHNRAPGKTFTGPKA